MQNVESRRGRRRRLTLKVALRRRLIHLRQTHPEYLIDPSPENVDCVCETSAFYFAKKFSRHSCGKRKHGRPKVGYGVCHGFTRWAAIQRSRSKRLARDLTAGRADYEGVEPAKGFFGELERWHLGRLRRSGQA